MRILLGALSLLSALLTANAGLGGADEPASAIALSLAWAAVYLVLGLLAFVRPVRWVLTVTAGFNGVVGVILGFLWFVARNFTDSQESFDRWILPFVIPAARDGGRGAHRPHSSVGASRAIAAAWPEVHLSALCKT